MKRLKINHFSQFQRRNRGFSLISVLLMATLAMSWLAASSMTLLPMFQYVGSSSSVVKVESAVESAADYAIGLLNDNTTRSTVDPELNSAESQVVLFPPSVVNQILPGGTLEATFFRKSPSFADYDASKKNFYGVGAQKASVSLPWRTLQVKATFGNLSRSIKVVLKPSFVSSSFTSNANPTNSFFPQAGFSGLDMIWLGQGSTTSAQDSGTPIVSDPDENGIKHSIAGDIASYGNILLEGNSQVGGHLQILSDGSSTGTATAKIGSNVSVNQFLQLQSSGQGSTQSGFTDYQSSDYNVMNFGKAGSDPSLTKITDGFALTGEGREVSPEPVPPAFTAPSSAEVHSSVFDSANPISGTDYAVQSLVVSSNVKTSVSDFSPARIFVEGNSTDAVQINGNLNVGTSGSGNPANVQIWYNGSGTITFLNNTASDTNVFATVYAPNANVVFKGSNGRSINFTGAITAKTISGGLSDEGVPNAGTQYANLIFPKNLNNSQTSSVPSTKSLSYSPSNFQVKEPNLRWFVASVFENPYKHN